MNDILFYALLILLVYYFFIYLPKQRQIKPINNPTLAQLQQQIKELQTDDQLNQQTILNLQEEIMNKETQIEQLRTNSATQPELKDVESLITNLLQQMKQLNHSLK